LSAASPSLVVCLHGVGASGADLVPLADALRPLLAGARVTTPDAPHPFEGGGARGRQWFSVAGITEANRAERMAAARAAFDRLLEAQIAAAGLSGRPERVALFGFSQGSIMALDGLASGRWPVAAVAASAGRLATPDPLTPARTTRVLLLHGEADPVIPASESRRAAERLTAAGLAVETRLFPRLGHSISPEEALIAGAFLAKALAR